MRSRFRGHDGSHGPHAPAWPSDRGPGAKPADRTCGVAVVLGITALVARSATVALAPVFATPQLSPLGPFHPVGPQRRTVIGLEGGRAT